MEQRQLTVWLVAKRDLSNDLLVTRTLGKRFSSVMVARRAITRRFGSDPQDRSPAMQPRKAASNFDGPTVGVAVRAV